MGLVAGNKAGLLRLDFEAKMATGSHDGTCPRNLLQGLVAGTSPPVCADLYGLNLSLKCFSVVAISLTNRGNK